MKRSAWALALLVLLAGSWLHGQEDAVGDGEEDRAAATANDVKAPEDVSYWMKKKLEFSQNVLAALTKSDFDDISENAQKMRDLNRFESFVRRRTPAYRTQLRFFQHANAELVRASEAKNIEAATLAFNQLTNSCVNCHKQLRDANEP
jgi:cytochrome c556